jgi:hypothetical protein
MPCVHGKGLAFRLDNAAGALQTLTSYVDSVSLENSVDMGETTTAGAEAKTFVSGTSGATLSISGKWDGTVTTGPDAILTGLIGLEVSSTFEYGPEGQTAGKVKKSGECFLTAYTVDEPANGVCTFSADFQVTGAVANGVWP